MGYTDITGLTGVAAQEAACIRPGYWVVEGWEVRRKGTAWWQGTYEVQDENGMPRQLMVHGETLRQVRGKIAEKQDRA